ncbi:TonB-dependent receptor plug domain-containing protein [Dyadobacter sp. 676]|uniref:TonB-dependent receptor plug domain-containing protein n=1 Tax=Dyadobacter sp. 676 TaxID=3088362 RepID=A0AAU8FIX7_9BACT
MKKTEPLLSSLSNCRGTDMPRKLLFGAIVGILMACQTVLAGNQQELMARLVTLKFQNQRFEKVISSIEKQTKARIVYSSERVNVDRTVNVEVNKMRLDAVLDEILSPLNLTYRVVGGQIVLENLTREQSGVPAKPETADRTVTGVVVDEKNAALPGVSVILKGTNRGTTTDGQGKFSLLVPDDPAALLTFSFVGYQSQDVALGAQTIFNIALKPDVGALDEVVVIGYGAVRKRDLTGSVVQLKSEQLKEVPSNNVLDAVQGKIAGADITRSSGQAGAGVNITIRGNRSIGGNNSPLIIVDGVQYGDLADINSNDIESMEVLKDASSIAIYGSRGANGVILITTKKGKSGRPDISFNSYAGLSQVTMYPRAMNITEFRDFKREAWRAAGVWNSPADDPAIFTNVAEYDALQKRHLDRLPERTHSPGFPAKLPAGFPRWVRKTQILRFC